MEAAMKLVKHLTAASMNDGSLNGLVLVLGAQLGRAVVFCGRGLGLPF